MTRPICEPVLVLKKEDGHYFLWVGQERAARDFAEQLKVLEEWNDFAKSILTQPRTARLIDEFDRGDAFGDEERDFFAPKGGITEPMMHLSTPKETLDTQYAGFVFRLEGSLEEWKVHLPARLEDLEGFFVYREGVGDDAAARSDVEDRGALIGRYRFDYSPVRRIGLWIVFASLLPTIFFLIVFMEVDVLNDIARNTHPALQCLTIAVFFIVTFFGGIIYGLRRTKREIRLDLYADRLVINDGKETIWLEDVQGVSMEPVHEGRYQDQLVGYWLDISLKSRGHRKMYLSSLSNGAPLAFFESLRKRVGEHA
ncbi:MAG: hypothetical protein LBD12_02935, partial [Clostridiales Family XIII bacterium]|jgi:hypothetical protein|nr:hypothetical protein [Clostridiales Family XIII bacterium]